MCTTRQGREEKPEKQLFLTLGIYCSHLQSFERRRQWQPTPVLLSGKSDGRRSLVGFSPWGREESDTTERLHFHFSLSCTGERNGNPLQCSCLENPKDRGAWWAAIYGVAQSRTRRKRLSSSISSPLKNHWGFGLLFRSFDIIDLDGTWTLVFLKNFPCFSKCQPELGTVYLN